MLLTTRSYNTGRNGRMQTILSIAGQFDCLQPFLQYTVLQGEQECLNMRLKVRMNPGE